MMTGLVLLRWRARILLVFMTVRATAGNSCIVTYPNGHMEKHGDCEHPDWKQVLEEIKAMAEGDDKNQEVETTKPQTTTTHEESTEGSADASTMTIGGSYSKAETSGVQTSTSDAMTVETTAISATTTQSTTKPPNADRDNCTASVFGGCYWADFIERLQTNVSRANKSCQSHGANLAVIPDRKTYDEVLAYARSILQTKPKDPFAGFWLGMTYDSSVGSIYPEGSFNESWYPGYPLQLGIGRNVLLLADVSAQTLNQGLKNTIGVEKLSGAICWKPRIMS